MLFVFLQQKQKTILRKNPASEMRRGSPDGALFGELCESGTLCCLIKFVT